MLWELNLWNQKRKNKTLVKVFFLSSSDEHLKKKGYQRKPAAMSGTVAYLYLQKKQTNKNI